MSDPSPESWGFIVGPRDLGGGVSLGVLPLTFGRVRLVRVQGWGVLEGW